MNSSSPDHLPCHLGSTHGREVCRLQVHLLEPSHEPTVAPAFFSYRLPFRIRDERLPTRIGRGTRGVREQVDQQAFRVGSLLRRPVADIRHAVLFEDPHGVIPEATQESVILSFRGNIRSEFVDLGGRLSLRGRGLSARNGRPYSDSGKEGGSHSTDSGQKLHGCILARRMQCPNLGAFKWLRQRSTPVRDPNASVSRHPQLHGSLLVRAMDYGSCIGQSRQNSWRGMPVSVRLTHRSKGVLRGRRVDKGSTVGGQASVVPDLEDLNVTQSSSQSLFHIGGCFTRQQNIHVVLGNAGAGRITPIETTRSEIHTGTLRSPAATPAA